MFPARYPYVCLKPLQGLALYLLSFRATVLRIFVLADFFLVLRSWERASWRHPVRINFLFSFFPECETQGINRGNRRDFFHAALVGSVGCQVLCILWFKHVRFKIPPAAKPASSGGRYNMSADVPRDNNDMLKNIDNLSSQEQTFCDLSSEHWFWSVLTRVAEVKQPARVPALRRRRWGCRHSAHRYLYHLAS